MTVGVTLPEASSADGDGTSQASAHPLPDQASDFPTLLPSAEASA